MRTAWRLLATQRDLRLVLSAGLISLSGDWVGGIAGGVISVSLSQRVPAARLLRYGAVAFGAIDHRALPR